MYLYGQAIYYIQALRVTVYIRYIKACDNIGSISTDSRVRSLILPEERDECGLIFPNSGW